MPAVYTDKNYMPFDGLYFIISWYYKIINERCQFILKPYLLSIAYGKFNENAKNRHSKNKRFFENFELSRSANIAQNQRSHFKAHTNWPFPAIITGQSRRSLNRLPIHRPGRKPESKIHFFDHACKIISFWINRFKIALQKSGTMRLSKISLFPLPGGRLFFIKTNYWFLPWFTWACWV